MQPGPVRRSAGHGGRVQMQLPAAKGHEGAGRLASMWCWGWGCNWGSAWHL